MSSFADLKGGTNQPQVAPGDSAAEKGETFALDFLPANLTTQCRSLIESYHEVHGFACLPDVLWKFGLGPFIERQRELRHFLKKASTARSAKKSGEGFVQIATAILSLEILASSFAGWSAIYPDAGEMARSVLKRNGRGAHMPLMEFYLYPPKYISPVAVAALAPPASRRAQEAELYRTSTPELSREKLAITYANALREVLGVRPPGATTST